MLGQTSLSPYRLHEISVLIELVFGHPRYCFTDVPPQPNSPSKAFPRPSDGTQKFRLVHEARFLRRSLYNSVSGAMFKVVVFQDRQSLPPTLHLRNRSTKLTRVKLNRVFFPRFPCEVRSLRCSFAKLYAGTVRISLIHSCASLIKIGRAHV